MGPQALTHRELPEEDTQKTEASPGVSGWNGSGWRGLWWALTHTGCGCLGNGLGVFFVADPKLTLFCKCSFLTGSKDTVSRPLPLGVSALLPGSLLPAWHDPLWEQPPLGASCRAFPEGLEARSVGLPSPCEGRECVSANQSLGSAVGGAMVPL